MYNLIPKKARAFVTSLIELADVLQDDVRIDGGIRDNTNTHPSSLQSQTSKPKYEVTDFGCFRCEVSGHKASDCPSKNGNRSSGNSREWNRTKGNGNSRVVCCSCQEEGHKSPEHPYKKTIVVRKIKKKAEPKRIRRYGTTPRKTTF